MRLHKSRMTFTNKEEYCAEFADPFCLFDILYPSKVLLRIRRMMFFFIWKHFCVTQKVILFDFNAYEAIFISNSVISWPRKCGKIINFSVSDGRYKL